MTAPLSFRWLGDEAMHLDTPQITSVGPMLLGCYGGCVGAGANKNEDAALLWYDPRGQWECAIVVDAHHSAQSAALLVRLMLAEEHAIRRLLDLPVSSAFSGVQDHLVRVFSSAAFRAECVNIRGEASYLMLVRKGDFVWWFAVGDCVAYVLHPSLARLGEYALNQRKFYEWIGHVNTFDLPVPGWSSGVRQLRPGRNVIVLLTDGLLECGTRPFENPSMLYYTFTWAAPTIAESISIALNRVHEEQGRDSATIIAWAYDSTIQR